MVDTDILIDVGIGAAVAKVHLEQLRQSVDLAVSAVTQIELIVGCRNKLERLIHAAFPSYSSAYTARTMT